MKERRDYCFQLLSAASCLLLVGYFISPTFLFLPDKIDFGPAVLRVRVTRIADLNYPPIFFGKVEWRRGEVAWQVLGEDGKVSTGSRLELSCKQLSSGRAGVIWCRSPKILSAESPSRLRQWLNRLVDSVGELWQKALPGPAGGFAEALLTGDEKNLGLAARDDFRRTGLQHVLALSGYNVTVLLVWLG